MKWLQILMKCKLSEIDYTSEEFVQLKDKLEQMRRGGAAFGEA
jgi:hypothetical protein